jgi:hypothetical protein
MIPNIEQWQHLARIALASGGPAAAWLASHGCDAATCQGGVTTAVIWLIGVVPPAVSVIWGMFAHTKDATLKAVEAIPGVQSINVSAADPQLRAIAADQARPKVSVGARP